MASAVVFALENKMSDTLYNVGSGKEISIKELALLIQKVVGHTGQIIWDSTKPDGTPRKLMDSEKLNNEGWIPKVELEKGIDITYKWFLENHDNIKEVKI